MRRSRKSISVASLLLTGIFSSHSWAGANPNLPSLDDLAGSNQPNIVVILTDDHGWPDIGAQGIFKDIKTPHTDKLAEGGVRFTSGYSTAAQCRPSRAGIVTRINLVWWIIKLLPYLGLNTL